MPYLSETPSSYTGDACCPPHGKAVRGGGQRPLGFRSALVWPGDAGRGSGGELTSHLAAPDAVLTLRHHP
ncbi:MAG: hypothetical protein WCA06_00575 [Terrimicrobiaceae bacterium]